MADQDATNDKATSSKRISGASRFTPAPKSRSCVVCRSRKVRCDKVNPCSNCRKANVACVFPSNDRPPKWARRLERITKEAESGSAPQETDGRNAKQVMERLRSLEGLVKELSGQLEHSNSASPSARDGYSYTESSGSPHNGHDSLRHTSPATESSVQEHFGRLVVQDKNRSRYIGSAFWSRMNDELDGLKMATQEMADHDSDSSDDRDSSSRTTITQELARTPSERNSFFFRHNLGSSSVDLREFHPLPSQIPFLLDTYAENVNFVIGVLHMPTVRQIVRNIPGADMTKLSPANEALLFSVYYAAVTSMEEDDVITNFGTTKAELNLKYRLGLEHALAKADFLNVPDLTLVQAFTNFMSLARRHDSPRFIWMMTGLLIRMGQSLGLQRDGSKLGDLTPYEVELRRRLWWSICLLDIRASEDQGTEITITRDSFDTLLPSNVSDKDLEPNRREPPIIRQETTEISPALVTYQFTEIVREMVAPGGKDGIPSLEVQSQLIDKLYGKVDQGFLRLTKDVDQPAYWMASIASLLVMSKMRLLIYLPVLFKTSNEHFSDEIRNKLLVSAIEVAEWNHALNAEESVRRWRWIYQTYTHWYSIVYMLLEVARRPLLPMVERAWVALQSVWLIPTQTQLDNKNKHWIPLRKLMAKARSHREEELQRLRTDARYVAQLESQNNSIPIPASSGPFAGGDSAELFLSHWRNLIANSGSLAEPALLKTMQPRDDFDSFQAAEANGRTWPDLNITASNADQNQMIHQDANILDSSSTGIPTDWTTGQGTSSAETPWLWADVDVSIGDVSSFDMNMDLDGDINWQNWLNAAKDLG